MYGAYRAVSVWGVVLFGSVTACGAAFAGFQCLLYLVDIDPAYFFPAHKTASFVGLVSCFSFMLFLCSTVVAMLTMQKDLAYVERILEGVHKQYLEPLPETYVHPSKMGL